MSIDTSLSADIHDLMGAIHPPAAPVDAILAKIDGPRVTSPIKLQRRRPFALGAAAAATIAIVTLPHVAPAFVQNLEIRYREALAALGGSAPPAPAQPFLHKLTVSDATLASARSSVRFTLTPPSGLPSDVVASSIQLAPVGVYSPGSKTWGVGETEVRFSYRRADGRSFTLLAARYDTALLPSRHLFEAREPAANGKVVLVKHERFAWRNGDQMVVAEQSDALGAEDIAAIRTSMHGSPIVLPAAHVPGTAGTIRVLRRP